MTKQNSTHALSHKLTRPLVIALISAVAVPALMAAPSAYAGDKASPRTNGNTYQADRAHDKRKAQAQRRAKSKAQTHRRTKANGQRERNWREDRRNGYGDWSNDRQRQRRLERAQRQQREAREHRRDERSDRSHRRDERRNIRIDRRHDRNDRAHRRNDRRDAREHRRHDRSHSRADRRNAQLRNERYWRRQARRQNNFRPFWNNRRHVGRNTGWNDYYNGYQTNYRSSLGISFIFGQPGYSRHRWAPSRYSFYQPGYMSYANYQATTQCQRVVIDGFHQGHAEQVSVLQCGNPYDGTYIVQGSEQIVQCYGVPRYDQPYYRR